MGKNRKVISDAFVEFGELRIVDLGHGEGWSVDKWIENKKMAGEWTLVFKTNHRTKLFKYLGGLVGKIDDYVEEKDNGKD